TAGAAPAPSSGTLSCVGSTIASFPGKAQVNVARLLQRNIPRMRILNESMIAGSAGPPDAPARQKTTPRSHAAPPPNEEIFFN
ncbi:hypothetical protein, partial [Duganella vulcania]|uniref:hypothetical protein n=1 Tax=Duganella vulcania TaxID=2692166 RepID=UPI001C2CE17E